MKKLIMLVLLIAISLSLVSCAGAGKTTNDKTREGIPCSDDNHCP